ncbi:hypothetical protein ACIHCQ_29620 [Streptomyces sp. NPDC052236]|uniref:hypothetical protein n=1 Tax=Streptomyces sp. NPDC052236 TaxID=3365686 RepID=UPI0037CE1DEF
MGTFAADDDAGAVRIADEVDHAGQFGDSGAPARKVPSWSRAGCQTCSGRARIARRAGSVTAYPTEKKVWIPGPLRKTEPSHSPCAPVLVNKGGVDAMAFTADGRTLLTTGSDGKLRRWNVATIADIRNSSSRAP